MADKFAALDVPDHEVWAGYSAECRRLIKVLGLLGYTQLRPIVLAALEHFTPDQIEQLLKMLLALTVRYQTVGKGRTGLLEIASARVAPRISTGSHDTPSKVWTDLGALVGNDNSFRSDFLDYSETRAVRARYMLTELEAAKYRRDHAGDDPELVPWEGLTLEHVLPRNPSGDWQSILAASPDFGEAVDRLGNLCLLAERPNREIANGSFARKAEEAYKDSRLELTSSIAANYEEWTLEELGRRQEFLADLAVLAWPLP